MRSAKFNYLVVLAQPYFPKSPFSETPLGFSLLTALATQGSRCAATLGYPIVSPSG